MRLTTLLALVALTIGVNPTGLAQRKQAPVARPPSADAQFRDIYTGEWKWRQLDDGLSLIHI